MFVGEEKMTLKAPVKYVTAALFKGIAACVAGFMGITIGGMAASSLGISAPALPPEFDQSLILLLYMIVWFSASVITGELFKRMGQNFLERFLCIFLFIYMIQNFLQTLEQIIFTTTVSFKFGVVFYLFPSLLISLAVALLWKPANSGSSILKEWPVFWGRRPGKSWLWRIAVAWLAYPVIYYAVGSSISRIVAPYYQDPSLNLGLTLPHWKVIVGMQLIRGLLFLLPVLPVIILWKGKTSSLGIWLGFAIFVQVATLMLLAYWLPPVLRITHAFELTVDSFLQAFVYAKLLYPGNKIEPVPPMEQNGSK